MKFREFRNEDAEFCFRTRSSAFIQMFYAEIGAELVTAGVNAFMPADYIRMSNDIEVFIVVERSERKGFFTIKRIYTDTAEIQLIYFNLDCLGKGYGDKSMQYIENWIKVNWIEVDKLILDTIVPKYNGKFYEKMGFQILGKSVCKFYEKEVNAIRYEKYIK